MNKRKWREVRRTKWQEAIDGWRSRPSPSAFRQLRELTKRMRAGTDQFPDAHTKERQQLLQEIEALKQQAAAVQPKDWRGYSTRVAAAIMREHTALSTELKRRGVPKPITQAWEDLAKRWGHNSGGALYTWVRRNR